MVYMGTVKGITYGYTGGRLIRFYGVICESYRGQGLVLSGLMYSQGSLGTIH